MKSVGLSKTGKARLYHEALPESWLSQGMEWAETRGRSRMGNYGEKQCRARHLNTRGISFLFFSNYKAPHKRWLPGSLSGLPLHCNSLCLAAKRSRCQRNKAKSWIPNSRKQKWPSKGGKAGSWQGLSTTKSSRPHFFTSETVPVLKETTVQARDKHSKERSQEKYRNSHRRLSTSPFKKLRSRNSLETSWSTKTTLGKQNITIDNKLPYQ